MITNIYFIRHAKAMITEEDALNPLTEEGVEAAKQLSYFFKDIPIHHIYSSPFLRAIQTIQGIATDKKLAIKTVDALKERSVANKFIKDFDAFSKNQWANFNFKLEGGESLNEVYKRAHPTIENIVKAHPGKNLIIGTHGTFLSVFLNAFDKTIGFSFWKNLDRPAVYLVSFQTGVQIEVKKIKHILV
jgi:2,3-bisphosphoglycerate-dependent phosphoglycerate mutase